MRTILIAIIIILGINLNAQNSDSTKAQIFINSEFEEKQSYCYEQDGQQNVNYCLSVIVNELEVILQTKFECILQYYDNEIERSSRNKKDSQIVTNIKNQKRSLKLSQKHWKKMQDANSEYWNLGGGTISGQYVAESLIKDLKDRILFLDNIISEESQGTKGLDCNKK